MTFASTAVERFTGTRQPARMVWLLLGVLTALAVLAYNAYTYFPFISDDALISLRYAQRLLAGDGLTWTDGERVEGYSNLLWVLLVAAGGRAGFDLIATARVLGCVAMASALLAITYAYRASVSGSALPASMAATLLAASGSVGIWAIGGLEQALVTALFAWSLATTLRLLSENRPVSSAVTPALCLGALSLTRPDGILLAAGVSMGVVLAAPTSQRHWSLSAILIAVPGICTVGQLIFRLGYYGEWVPNTAYVKVAPSLALFGQGLSYLGAGFLYHAPAVSLALTAFRGVNEHQHRPRLLIIAVPCVVWAMWVVFIGGDIFPGRRHFLPLIVGVSFVAAEGLDNLLRLRSVRFSRGALGLASVGAIALAVQGYDHANQRGITERWEWDGRELGLFLKTAFGESRPLVAVDAAGAIPYWSGLPSLDMLGLTDHHIARHPPPDRRRYGIGHGLGDGAYVLRRAPDLIVFCGPHGSATGCFPGGRQLLGSPEFRTRYVLAAFEVGDDTPFLAKIWVRRESPKVAIQRTRESVRIPAYLFAASGSSTRLELDGRLTVRFPSGSVAVLRDLQLPPGEWTAKVVPAARAARLDVTRRGRILLTTPAHVSGSFDTGEISTGLDVRMVFSRGGAAVERIELEHVGIDSPD